MNQYGILALQALADYSGENVYDLQDFGQAYAPPMLGNDLLGTEYLGADADYLGAELLGADGNALMNLLGTDLLGVEQLLGAEGAALLGRDPRRKRALAAKVAQAVGAGGVQAVPRQGYLPIPATLLPALNPTQVINIFPQAQGGIQLTRLLIPSNQGQNFLINDVVVATRSQFFSPGSISGVLCSEVQTLRLKGDVAYPGTIVSISVTNTSGVDQTLSGAAFLAEAREARAL